MSGLEKVFQSPQSTASLQAVYYLLLTAQKAIYATEVQKQANKVDPDAKEIKM